jgi:hypothetical protein
MSKVKKTLILPLLLSMLLVLLVPGCQEQAADEETNAPVTKTPSSGTLSQPEVQQIVTDSIATYKALTTYRFDMDMDIAAEAIGGSQPGKFTGTLKSSGGANLASKEMQMNMDMSMNTEGIGDENGPQSLGYEMYMLSDWAYMKMAMTGMDEQWAKMPVTDELKESFALNIIDQQMEPLYSPLKVELLRYEKVDGQECYVLSVLPDWTKITKWLSERQGATQGVDWANMENLSDVFKKTEFVYYVIKESNLLKKMVVSMLMEYTSEQAGISSGDYDRMTMEIHMNMNLYDHNKSFSVKLPTEAENATQMSPNAFSN